MRAGTLRHHTILHACITLPALEPTKKEPAPESELAQVAGV